MKKSFKQFRIKKPAALKEEQEIKKKERLHKYAKNVKSKELHVDDHVVISEERMKNRLMIITSALLVVAAVFLVIFQFVRINNMKAMISNTHARIDELKYIENNIVEASEEDASIKYDIFDFIITNNRTELIKLIQEYPY